MSGITEQMLEDAFQEFSERCKYRYCEYFWFPGSPRSIAGKMMEKLAMHVFTLRLSKLSFKISVPS